MAIPRRSRAKLSLGSGLFAMLLLWLVTPTPRMLYHPIAHAVAMNAESQDIANSIIVPSYNEAPNMYPL